MSDVLSCCLCDIHIFFTLKPPQGCGDVLFNTFKEISSFYFLMYCFVKCQNVGVCLHFFTTLSKAVFISFFVTKDNSQVLIIAENLHFKFSVCFYCPPPQVDCHFSFSLIKCFLKDFKIKNEDNLTEQFSSNDSSTMTIGNSLALFSESDSERLHFVLCLYRP